MNSLQSIVNSLGQLAATTGGSMSNPGQGNNVGSTNIGKAGNPSNLNNVGVNTPAGGGQGGTGSPWISIGGYGSLVTSGGSGGGGSGPVIPEKISNQMEGRGWTQQDIDKLYGNPFTTRAAANKANGNPATAYYDEQGNYVSVDNVTKQVIQVSNKNDPEWYPDSSIQDPYIPEVVPEEPGIIVPDEIFPFE